MIVQPDLQAQKGYIGSYERKGTMWLTETGSGKYAKKPGRRTDQKLESLIPSSRNYAEKFKISFGSTRFSGTKKPIIEEAL